MRETPKSIGQGRWNENISWEFLVTRDLPDLNLCTAVCCVTVLHRKLLLVKNKRGWELPAGHIENNESIDQALRRETREEAGVEIESPSVFGYKKLTAVKPMLRGEGNDYYPFPHSYVVFAHANVALVNHEQFPGDIVERKTAIYSEALQLFSDASQYRIILDFLLAQQLLELIR